VEKQQFVDLLGRFSKSSENEALNIMALKDYFPYSQVFHALSARTTKDHRFLEQKLALQLAAVYAADRVVLKQVMSDDELPVGKSLPPYGDFILRGDFEEQRSVNGHDLTFGDEVEIEVASSEMSSQIVETSTFTEAPVQDLSQARNSDAGALNFQQRAHQLQAEAAAAQAVAETSAMVAPAAPNAVDATDAASAPMEEAAQPMAKETLEPAQPQAARESAEPEETNVADQVIHDLEKLNRLKHNFEALFEANKASIILRDAARTVGATPDEDLSRVHQARQRRIAELVSSLDPELNSADTLDALDYGTPSKNFLEEINNSRQALEPENQKQKEQLRVIDEFIKTQPGLQNKDKANAASEDLSTSKTGVFSDNVVSETLVDILVKQGKRDKAIEVLKKLIWKFPQKKAYFAAQIEDLKK